MKLGFIIDCNTAMHGELHTNQLNLSSGYYMHVYVCIYRETDYVCAREVL